MASTLVFPRVGHFTPELGTLCDSSAAEQLQLLSRVSLPIRWGTSLGYVRIDWRIDFDARLSQSSIGTKINETTPWLTFRFGFVAVFRRLGSLNAEPLLYLQAELCGTRESYNA